MDVLTPVVKSANNQLQWLFLVCFLISSSHVHSGVMYVMRRWEIHFEKSYDTGLTHACSSTPVYIDVLVTMDYGFASDMSLWYSSTDSSTYMHVSLTAIYISPSDWLIIRLSVRGWLCLRIQFSPATVCACDADVCW